MAALFNGSSEYVSDRTPILTVPITMAGWVWVDSLAATTGWMSIGTNAGNDDGFGFFVFNPPAVWGIEIDLNGTAGTSLSVGTPIINTWAYLVGRFISATNWRLSVLQANGTPAHVASTTSVSLTLSTSGTAVHIGRYAAAASLFHTGRLAEVWYTNTDIQPDGGQLNEDLLRRLAYRGPWSVPHIAGNLVGYHSFLKIGTDGASAIDFDRNGLVWTGNAAIKNAAHPPLASGYLRGPKQTRRIISEL